MFTLLKKKLNGGIIDIFQYLKSYQKEEGVDLLPMMPECSTRITDEDLTERTPNKKAFPDFFKGMEQPAF